MRSFISLINRVAGVSVVVIASMAITEVSHACTMAPPTPPPPPQITHPGGSNFNVRISGYSTFGASTSDNCACGLSLGGLPATRAQVVFAGTLNPVPGFDMVPDADVAEQLDQAKPTGNWQGFQTQIGIPIPEGLDIDIIFTVDAVSGREVAAALPANAVGTGLWDPREGIFPDPEHFDLVMIPIPEPEVSALASHVQSGFYECKDEKIHNLSVSEDTLLMLINEDTAQHLCATIVMLDGNENVVACGIAPLSPEDLDEINLCLMTDNLAPQAGVVEVVTTAWLPGIPGAAPMTCPPDEEMPMFRAGAYAWVKDVIYKGKKKKPENPFSATQVNGIGKTPLRLTPTEVADPFVVFSKCWDLEVRPERLPPRVYAEDTYDPDQANIP
jgi:hypothetical protein